MNPFPMDTISTNLLIGFALAVFMNFTSLLSNLIQIAISARDTQTNIQSKPKIWNRLKPFLQIATLVILTLIVSLLYTTLQSKPTTEEKTTLILLPPTSSTPGPTVTTASPTTELFQGVPTLPTPTPTPSSTNMGDSTQIINKITPDGQTYCLGIANSSLATGTQIIVWTCNGNKDQSWQIQYIGNDGENYYQIVNLNSNQCLALDQRTTPKSTTPIQWPCNGRSDQQWYIKTKISTNFFYSLINRNSKQCLGILQEKVFSGATPMEWACNGNMDQTWRLPTPPTTSMKR